MRSKSPTTRQLIRRAQEGDREALEKLFARSYPDLVQAARFRLGPLLRGRMDTLDLAQTAYHEAFRSLGRYRYRGKGSFRRWLFSIVENKIRSNLEYFKAKRRDLRRDVAFDAEKSPPANATPPTRLVVEKEDRKRLEEAMDQLPETYREVIVCRYYLGMPWREVGEELERSEEAAQMLCRRALLRLKRIYRGNAQGKEGTE